MAEGHVVVPLDCDPPPDKIVVRGCSVTAKAERECRRALARLRGRFPSSSVEVAGCMKERAVATKAPEPGGPIPARTARAHLKVQDGCSGHCAFCIVPSFRGPPRSVPFAQMLARASAFLAAGYRELVVTGCNLALYRDGGHGLADALAALAELEGPLPHRVRLGSLEPGVCDAAVLDAFATHPNICRFLHLSVQSGSNGVLARMGRPYEIDAVDRFCSDAVRRLGPRLSLGADVIAGFPGETEAEFAATRGFLGRHPFSNIHVFPYSERPGTPAAVAPGAVPPAMRRARAKELAGIGLAARAAFAAGFAGETVEVCMENARSGWTGEYLRCQMENPGNGVVPGVLSRRSLVAARVVRVDGDRLAAVPTARG